MTSLETTDPADDFWTLVGAFFDSPLGTVVKVAFIIIGAVIVTWLLHIAIRRIVHTIVSGVKKGQNAEDTQALAASPLAAVRVVQRTRTLGSVLTNVVNVTIVIITILLVVHTIAPSVLSSFALLSAALGAGLGFGAQNIVKDILNGIFMVIEDQLGVGDVVDTGSATGVVERVGIRITQIRDVNGTLWFVRNGEILRVGNMSQGWSRVIIDLAVPYEADVTTVQERILQTAVALTKEPKWRVHFLGTPELWGIESVSDTAIVLRVVAKTRTSSKDEIARELRSRFVRALDELEVRTPSLETVVLEGWNGAGSVEGARPPKTKPVTVNEAPRLGKRGQKRKQKDTP